MGGGEEDRHKHNQHMSQNFFGPRKWPRCGTGTEEIQLLCAGMRAWILAPAVVVEDKINPSSNLGHSDGKDQGPEPGTH